MTVEELILKLSGWNDDTPVMYYDGNVDIDISTVAFIEEDIDGHLIIY
jgi:hypothetical protein